MTDLTPGVIELLDLLGIFVFAISGALVGVRRGFNVIGLIVLAECTTLGGGVLRDLIIGATQPHSSARRTSSYRCWQPW